MLGPSPLVLLPALGVRIAGYSLAALGLRRAGVTGLSVPLFTFTRIIIGVVVGLMYWAAVLAFAPAPLHGTPAYLALAFPRALIWLALVWSYLTESQRKSLGWAIALLGCAFSYALDLVTAALVHVLPGMHMAWC